PCDARIGRFCYWSDTTDTVLPAEPAGIRQRRERLLAVLDSAAHTLPGDAWVAGQRVRYLLEAGLPDSAAAAAQACRATAWWCAALEGLAWHVAQDFEDADLSFEAALQAMPEEERCRWTDLSDLLEGQMWRSYHKLSCAERQGVNARVWWLAQPLWWMPGNDRRTEHYARVTMVRLLEDASSPYGPWGEDERELIMRYGWPLAWVREDRGDTHEPVAIGLEAEPGWHFLPDNRALDTPPPGDEPGALDERGALERYAPAYARAFTLLEPDFAAFRRGDSTLVVATWDVAGDKAFRSSTYAAALVLAHDERSRPVVIFQSDTGSTGVLAGEAPWNPALLSLELYAPGSRAVVRARGAPPAGDAALSGVLLFDPAESLPADLPAALARVHAGGIPVGRRIGLYWEAYGFSPREDVPTAVTVTAAHRSWLRRLASALGLAPKPGGVRLEWHETMQPTQGRLSRALVLDLTALRAGRYRVEVTMSPPGRASVTSSRALLVHER
ncbi:MAG TPA: hypothetical protein VMT21_07390, partial [Gemmatimonadales bacterium]|nr:hypothetical protein [Gemmatimonadales bacterium]